MRELTPRQRSVGLHALWGALALGANRMERGFRSRGAPAGSALLATVVGWNGLLLLLERRRPFDPGWNPPAREARTDGAFFLTSTISALSGQALGATLAHRFGARRRRSASSDRTPLVGHLGIAGGLVASLLTSDLIHYGLHRLGHEWGPAWKFHSIHHSPERLHIFNATRFHPVEQAVEGVLEGFALGAVGFSAAQHVTHSTARATYGQLQHSNISVDSGALDHVFATPDLHRWHHSEIYAEGDTNYGAVISVWDRLLGTFFRPDRAFDAKLGVGRMPGFPQRFRGLLTTPFRWATIKRDNADTWYGEVEVNPDLHHRS
jgi:sterol desaturase/sphingolipid hydroxylase (fatty acid hydroxylase superfamily)